MILLLKPPVTARGWLKMRDRFYLDHNATSPLRPVVRQAMLSAMDGAHNPSSIHREGRAAKHLLEDARSILASRLSVPKEGVIFTAGGTEANNLALYGLVRGPSAVRHLFIGATEHDAMSATALALVSEGVTVETVPVTTAGVLDIDWLAERLATYDAAEHGAFAVVAMLANNETGVIHPISKLGPIVWPKGGFVVVDAVQGLGKLPINFDNLGADLLTIGAHKVGGPVGVGALLMKPGISLAPHLTGGGQEQYRRAGTENIPGIIGLAKVVEIVDPSEYSALAALRDELEAALPETVSIWGKDAPRLPNTSCFSAPQFAAETQTMVMDLAGFAISAGSACSSGKVRRSGVVKAMGGSDEAASSAIRVSLGWDTKPEAITGFLTAWIKEFDRIRARSAA
ncbi:MAG: cysteine desulfurase family protein [Pseudomonadota bacterium]